jgi:uncharacterized membrane protein
LRIRVGNELLLLNLLAALLIIIIIFLPPNILRIILGTLFVIFFPGYVLMVTLFPGKGQMGGVERIALSFGMSIAVVPLIGLILNYTPWGIRLESILGAVASFIFIMSLIAWFRRQRLPREERFGAEFHVALPSREIGIWDKTLSILLLLAILGAFGTVGYIIASPKVGERFSEFYILGLEGKAVDYPTELAVGEEGMVIVGIINNERKVVSYRVEVKVDDEKKNEVGPVVLEHDEQWEGEVGFVLEKVKDNQRVEFLLYKNDGSEAYLTLHLWVDVTQ